MALEDRNYTQIALDKLKADWQAEAVRDTLARLTGPEALRAWQRAVPAVLSDDTVSIALAAVASALAPREETRDAG